MGGLFVWVIPSKPYCWGSVWHLETTSVRPLNPSFLAHNEHSRALWMKPWKPSMWKPFSKVTFLCVPAWVRRMLKYSRDRGLERWKVFIEFLLPPGFSSSHSLPGHMLGILRGWEAEWGGRLKTLSSVRSPMWSASCDSVAIPRPAWGSRGDWPKCLPEQESYATCHLPPSLCQS